MMARELLTGPERDDLLPGDLVRCSLYRGTWWIKEITGDCATIAQDGDHREIVPLVYLRRIRHRGWSLDIKR